MSAKHFLRAQTISRGPLAFMLMIMPSGIFPVAVQARHTVIGRVPENVKPCNSQVASRHKGRREDSRNEQKNKDPFHDDQLALPRRCQRAKGYCRLGSCVKVKKWCSNPETSAMPCIIYRWGSLAGDRGKETKHRAWDAMASPSIRT